MATNLADLLLRAQARGPLELRRRGRLRRDARWQLDLTGGTVLVLGSEGAGVRPLVRERCDAAVSIPMHGQVGSLNVAVAAGILLYEAERQRAPRAP